MPTAMGFFGCTTAPPRGEDEGLPGCCARDMRFSDIEGQRKFWRGSVLSETEPSSSELAVPASAHCTVCLGAMGRLHDSHSIELTITGFDWVCFCCCVFSFVHRAPATSTGCSGVKTFIAFCCVNIISFFRAPATLTGCTGLTTFIAEQHFIAHIGGITFTTFTTFKVLSVLLLFCGHGQCVRSVATTHCRTRTCDVFKVEETVPVVSPA